MRVTSQLGIDLVKSFEGLRLESYQDSIGKWTIGYGHTNGVVKGQTCTQQQAEQYLRDDLAGAEHAVNASVHVDITQHQFDALVSFAYNCGVGNLWKSDVLAATNRNDIAAATADFEHWDHAGGVVVDGLLRRRKAEAALYATPDTPATAPAASPPTTPWWKRILGRRA